MTWYNQYIKSVEFKHNLKELIISPVCTLVYNDIYIYIWLICLYHVFLILMIVINIYLLSKLLANKNR